MPEFALQRTSSVRIEWGTGTQVGNLFRLAQRAALNVDAAIDEIMEEGKDIPF